MSIRAAMPNEEKITIILARIIMQKKTRTLWCCRFSWTGIGGKRSFRSQYSEQLDQKHNFVKIIAGTQSDEVLQKSLWRLWLVNSCNLISNNVGNIGFPSTATLHIFFLILNNIFCGSKFLPPWQLKLLFSCFLIKQRHVEKKLGRIMGWDCLLGY